MKMQVLNVSLQVLPVTSELFFCNVYKEAEKQNFLFVVLKFKQFLKNRLYCSFCYTNFMIVSRKLYSFTQKFF